MATVKCW